MNIGYEPIAGLPPDDRAIHTDRAGNTFALVQSSRQVVESPDAASAALVASPIDGLPSAGQKLCDDIPVIVTFPGPGETTRGSITSRI
jgi:hypothetical protein